MDVSVFGYVIPTEVIGWTVGAFAAVGTLTSTLILKNKESQNAARLHLANATSDAQVLRRVEVQNSVRLVWQASQAACVKRQVRRAPLQELRAVADELSSLVAVHEPYVPASIVVLVRELSEALDGLYTPEVDDQVQVTKERLVCAVRSCLEQTGAAQFEAAA